MKTRQAFERIRNRKKERLTLRVRMVIWVQVELLACVGLADYCQRGCRWRNDRHNFKSLFQSRKEPASGNG